MSRREEQLAYYRHKLRPYVSEVMNRLQQEENRRELYELIRTRKGNIKLSMLEQQTDSKKA